jgi:hypothetical protein
VSVKHAVRCLALLGALAGCGPGLSEQLGLVTAGHLAGSYTGVLEGVTVGSLDDVEDPERHVIVDLDLLHQLTIREAGELTLRIESSVIPPLRAIILGVGPVAINAEFVECERLAFSGSSLDFDAVKVKQIVFVQHEGEWILVLQVIRVGVEAQNAVDDVYVYQYVSYPSRVAERMSEEEAILYVNTILRLASEAQRLSLAAPRD